MANKLEKKTKTLYQSALNLPLEALYKLEDLDRAGKNIAEIKRQGAIKEIDKMHKKFCAS